MSASSPTAYLASLAARAQAAGIEVDWIDHAGTPRRVAPDTQAALLQALGLGCGDDAACRASLAALQRSGGLPPLVTARCGQTLRLSALGRPGADHRAELACETGGVLALAVHERADGLHLPLEAAVPPGYHALRLQADGQVHTTTLALAPLRAPQPTGRAWGTAVQVHALRPAMPQRWAEAGLGDYGALAALARAAGGAGAQALMTSPTHAGFAALPGHCSPYSPSNRLAHNVLLIDPVAVAGPQAAAQAARSAGIEALLDAPWCHHELIDWPRAGALRLRWLRALFEQEDGASEQAAEGLSPATRDHALFEALHGHFMQQGLADWRQWPAAWRHRDHPAVAAFAREQAHEVAFHTWLQQQAARQLAQAQQAAQAAGMRTGRVADLAVGSVPQGSQAWADRSGLLAGVSIGAPPDPLGPGGQTWGLAAPSPHGWVQQGFAGFIALLRHAFHAAGGVRIDHVLGLQRLWLVPDGAPATEGAYLRYPLRDLLNLVMLEAHRHGDWVIGEDLGTVPPGLRTALAEAGVLGMQVLWFQRDPERDHKPDHQREGAPFLPPQAWSDQAVALTTTHDLPTAAGWWQGRDLEWRSARGELIDETQARAQRAADRQALAQSAPRPGAAPADLAIDWVAATPSPLAIVPVEDLLGLVEQPNLPGAEGSGAGRHPNWRRRLGEAADALLDAPHVAPRLARLQQARHG